MIFTDNGTFSERLTTLREEKQLSRQKVADDLQISRASLEYYEKGLRKPDIEVAARIADYYNVSTDYLLGRAPARLTVSENETLKICCDYLKLSEKAVEKLAYFSSIGFDMELDAILSETAIIDILVASLSDYDYCIIRRDVSKRDLSSSKTEEERIEKQTSYNELSDEAEFNVFKLWSSIRRELDSLCTHSDEDLDKYIEWNQKIEEDKL